MSHLRHIYRSASCRALAHKVATSDVYDTLDINIRIEEILKNRDSKTVADINQSIADQTPFSLFSDKNHYCIIIPCNLVVACYVDSVQMTLERCKDDQQFRNRVKLAFSVYEHFRAINRPLDGGKYGNVEISKDRCRKEVSIGTQYNEFAEG